MNKPIRSSLGSLQRRALSPVSKPGFLDFCSACRPPASVTMRAHPSLMRLLFRVPSLNIPAQNLSISSFTCLGFRPSSRHHDRAATDREASQGLATVRPRLSQPLDGFIRALARRLVSSRCHVQGSICSRASLPAQPLSLIGRSLPPCRCCIVARAAPSTFAEVTALPRAMPLGFEAFLRTRPRSTSPVIHLARSRSLPQFRLLQVPSSLDVGTGLPSTFRSWCFRVDVPAHLQRLTVESLRVVSSPNRLDLLEFSSLPSGAPYVSAPSFPGSGSR